MIVNFKCSKCQKDFNVDLSDEEFKSIQRVPNYVGMLICPECLKNLPSREPLS